MSECGLFWVSEILLWIGGGGKGHYFGWVGVAGGALFWVSGVAGGFWDIILGEWGWVGHYFG